MITSFEDLKGRLRDAGFKMTPQRLSIAKTVQDNVGKHLSTEEIYDIVRLENPEIGLATVYRTLQLLEEIDIVRSLNIEDGKVRYELYLDAGHHNHHHLICQNCGKVLEFREDLLDELEARIENEHGFKILDHKLKFYGICSHCNENERE